MDGAAAHRKYPQFGPGNSDLLIGTEGVDLGEPAGHEDLPGIADEDHHRAERYPRDSQQRPSGQLINAIRTGEPNVSPVDIAWRAEMICQPATSRCG